MGADGRDGAVKGTAGPLVVWGIRGLARDEAVSAAVAVSDKLENRISHGANIASRRFQDGDDVGPCFMIVYVD